MAIIVEIATIHINNKKEIVINKMLHLCINMLIQDKSNNTTMIDGNIKEILHTHLSALPIHLTLQTRGEFKH